MRVGYGSRGPRRGAAPASAAAPGGKKSVKSKIGIPGGFEVESARPRVGRATGTRAVQSVSRSASRESVVE